MPNQTGSNPRETAMGVYRGAQIRTMMNSSMMQPIISMLTCMNRMTPMGLRPMSVENLISRPAGPHQHVEVAEDRGPHQDPDGHAGQFQCR